MMLSLLNYVQRIAVATSIVAAVLLTTRTSHGQANLAAEARAAADYLNQVRANPRAFANQFPSFGDADVEARPALTWNTALQKAAERKAQFMAQTEQFEHVMTINGQKVGMNQWMREAGYQLADHFKNDATNLECLYGEGGNDLNGIGRRVMNTFFAEGKDGGHVLPIMGRGFWTPCKDIGIGIATRPGGFTYVSVLVGIYDPFNPNAQPPGQPNQNPNPVPNPNPNPVPVPNPNPVPQPLPGQVQVTVSNASLVTVPVTYTSGGQKAVHALAAGVSVNLAVDPSSQVSYLLPGPSAGLIVAAAATNKLDIPQNACNLKLQNNGPGKVTVTIETPVFKDGQYQMVPQTFEMPAPSAAGQLVTKGTRIKAQSDTGSMSRVLQQDAETITFPSTANPAPGVPQPAPGVPQPAPPVPQPGQVGPAPLTASAIVGVYQHDPVTNDWHIGRISLNPNNTLTWANKAGASWTLTPDLGNKILRTGPDNPYQNDNIRDFTVELKDGQVHGFRFNGALYRRTGN